MSALPRRISLLDAPPRLRIVRKYRNQPTTTHGRTFASKKEAKRYEQLKLLERNQEVRNIRLQVSYNLVVGDLIVGRYRADFVYEELRRGQWNEVVEDVKGMLTPVYRLKRKLMKAIYGVEIRES